MVLRGLQASPHQDPKMASGRPEEGPNKCHESLLLQCVRHEDCCGWVSEHKTLGALRKLCENYERTMRGLSMQIVMLVGYVIRVFKNTKNHKEISKPSKPYDLMRLYCVRPSPNPIFS